MEFIKGFLLPILIGIIITLGLCILLYIWIGPTICNEVEETSGIETEWHFWKDCYVNHNGHFIPLKNWRGVDLE